MRRNKAFTLLELLVVVAIIGILASLLLPALNRARYLAKLAQCTSNLHQLSLGVIAYTGDNNECYPYRSVIIDGGREPMYLKFLGNDDRPKMRPYLKINLFACPLAPRMTGATLDTGSGEVYASYEMWFGGRFDKNDPATGMVRVGDLPPYGGERFDVLISDLDRTWDSYRQCSHPDRPKTLKEQDFYENTGPWFTGSAWGVNSLSRGMVDRNFAHADGSVRRLNNIASTDARMVDLPGLPGDPSYPAKTFLPPYNK